ncbi:MAG: YqaA family protein [bacterium]
MKLFAPLYDRVMAWSRHPRAARYLAAVSFCESSFFPIPTAVMLAPMVLADRRRAWHLARLATVASVLGGVFGYGIGYFLFDQLGEPIINFYHANERFAEMQQWFGEYGVWLVLLAGVTPIPYKIFTIASGLLGLSLPWFVLASLAGRAAQFFLVAALLRWGGARLEQALAKWMEPIGWSALALIAIGYLWWR